MENKKNNCSWVNCPFFIKWTKNKVLFDKIRRCIFRKNGECTYEPDTIEILEERINYLEDELTMIKESLKNT